MVSPEKNPLPAEVRIKRHNEVGEEFYYVDQLKWYTDGMTMKCYQDPVQIEVRKLLNWGMVQTFALFQFKYDHLIKKYMPRLPLPHDCCLERVIEIIKSCETVIMLEITDKSVVLSSKGKQAAAKERRAIAEKFVETCKCITCGYIARLLLDTISTYQVCKNWNSHRAKLGPTMWKMGAMLAGLDSAAGALIDQNVTQLIPQGNMQTGHKHGHHEVSYVEYMTSAKETSVSTGTEELYLDHIKFRSSHHDKKVREIMDRHSPNINALVPRPMRAHTFDFNLSYGGACLIDGECKEMQADHEKAILVFHSLDQLAFKNVTLALLTTNNSFTFFQSWIVHGAGYIQTTYYELKKFKLGPITDINTDLDKDAEHLQEPPDFPFRNESFVETDKTTLDVWKKLRSEIKVFMGIILSAVDMITDDVSGLNIQDVCEWWGEAYKKGWWEPNFTATDNSDPKTRRCIENQQEYIYSRENFEGETQAERDARVNQILYKGMQNVLQSNTHMSDHMQELVEGSMEHHKPPDTGN